LDEKMYRLKFSVPHDLTFNEINHFFGNIDGLFTRGGADDLISFPAKFRL